MRGVFEFEVYGILVLNIERPKRRGDHAIPTAYDLIFGVSLFYPTDACCKTSLTHRHGVLDRSAEIPKVVKASTQIGQLGDDGRPHEFTIQPADGDNKVVSAFRWLIQGPYVGPSAASLL
jgi:hypothetical protein